MLNLSELLETALNAAREGAAILQAYAHQRADLVIDHKGRNDLVSQADRESEAAIIEILAGQTPEFGIVAEETGGERRGIATWYIDPLDGTTNYLHGIPHWAVSIALVAHAGTPDEVGVALKAETPVVAVVYDPSKEELFTAMHGVGAWLNEHRISCSRSTSLQESLLGTGLPFRDFSFTDQYLPMLADAIHASRGVRRVGAASLDMAWVACGRFDGCWFARRAALSRICWANRRGPGMGMWSQATAISSLSSSTWFAPTSSPDPPELGRVIPVCQGNSLIIGGSRPPD